MTAIPYPKHSDYQLSLLAPHRFLQVASLRGACAALDHFGLPKLWSGAYAAVFQMQLPNGKSRALRCPTKPLPHAAAHYKQVHTYLLNHPADYLLKFEYIPSGLTAASVCVDVVVADWISGVDLKGYLVQLNGIVTQALLDEWRQVALSMVRASIAHGDLQHENILIEDRAGRPRITLVDYDSLVLPDNVGAIEQIAGVEHYQHPMRKSLTRKTLEVDRFSMLVVETTLRALAQSPGLWHQQKLQQANALLFDKFDFANPSQSSVFKAVRALGGDCARLADALALACTDPSPIAAPYPWEILGSTSVIVSGHAQQRAGGIRPLPSWMLPQGAPLLGSPGAPSCPSPTAARSGATVPVPDWTSVQTNSVPSTASAPPPSSGASMVPSPHNRSLQSSQVISPVVALAAAIGAIIFFSLLSTMC